MCVGCGCGHTYTYLSGCKQPALFKSICHPTTQDRRHFSYPIQDEFIYRLNTVSAKYGYLPAKYGISCDVVSEAPMALATAASLDAARLLVSSDLSSPSSRLSNSMGSIFYFEG